MSFYNLKIWRKWSELSGEFGQFGYRRALVRFAAGAIGGILLVLLLLSFFTNWWPQAAGWTVLVLFFLYLVLVIHRHPVRLILWCIVEKFFTLFCRLVLSQRTDLKDKSRGGIDKEKAWHSFCKIANFLVGAALLLPVCLSLYSNRFSQSVGSVCMFLAGGYLSICFYRWFRVKNHILLIFFLLSIGGIIVYHCEARNTITLCHSCWQRIQSGNPSSLCDRCRESTRLISIFDSPGGRFSAALTSVNNMLSTFFPSRGDYDYNDHFWYHLYHLAVHLFFGMLLASLWGHRVIGSIFDYFIPEQRKFIFWFSGDISDSAFDFAEKLRWRPSGTSEKNRIFQIQFLLQPLEDTAEHLKGYCNKALAKHFLLREFDFDTSCTDWHRQAPRHFFISDDQMWNVRMAQSLLQSMGKVDYNVKIYLKIGDSNVSEMISDWVENFCQDKPGLKKVEIIILSEFSLTAKAFVQAYPMLKSPGIHLARPKDGNGRTKIEVNGSFRLLLLGFNWLGKEILKECVCNSQFIGTDFSADVVDADSGKFERFQEQCRTAVQEYNLHFFRENVLSGDFVSWLKNGVPEREKLSSYNRIVICLGDDSLNIETALFLAEIAREQGAADKLNDRLFVYCSADYLPTSHKEDITFFGSRKSFFDLIANDDIDDTAKMMNYYWSWDSAVDKEGAWQNADAFDRESSRASAVGCWNLLRLIGFGDPEPGKFEGALKEVFKQDNSVEEYFEKISSNLDFLAETEHLRWNAFLYMRGIQSLSIADLQKIPGGEKKANHIKDRNSHAALVPYSKLPEVDAAARGKSPEACRRLYLQKNDLDFVIYLPAIQEKNNKRRLEILRTLHSRLLKNYFPELENCIAAYQKDCQKKIDFLSERQSG